MSNPKGFDDDMEIWSLHTPELNLPRRRQQERFEFDINSDFDSFGSRGSPINLVTNERPTSSQGITVKKIEEDSSHVKIVSFISEQLNLFCGHVLVHPFIVLRRQCQVSRKSLRYHLTPFTPVSVMVRLRSLQGIGSLWKGVASTLLVKGMVIMAESVIHETTSLNKELSASKFTLDNLLRHLTLKAAAIVIVTPFFCASLVETVQSSVAIESPSILDSLREGLFRLSHWTSASGTRLFPIWSLWGPAVLYGVSHYCIYSVSRSSYRWIMEKVREFSDEEETVSSSGTVANSENEIVSDLLGNFTADVLMYPIETVYHRLCLQGTRTIIDSVDIPGTVSPIISNYDGFSDCYNTVQAEEGMAGLFKGFGALILQYTVQFVFIKCSKLALKQLVSSY